MRPAIEPGDWLLVDPTVRRWPRRGSIVVFREPFTDVLAIKRVAARPGDWVRFADAWLRLGDDEAWLLGDATDDELAAAGFGPAADSRRYGPVPVEALVGRAWFRYAPASTIGRLPRPPDRAGRHARPGSIRLDGGPRTPTHSPRRHPRGASVAPAAQAGWTRRDGMIRQTCTRPLALALAAALLVGACGSAATPSASRAPSARWPSSRPRAWCRGNPQRVAPTATPDGDPGPPHADPIRHPQPSPAGGRAGPRWPRSRPGGGQGQPRRRRVHVTLPKGWRTLGLTAADIKAMLKTVPAGTVPQASRSSSRPWSPPGSSCGPSTCARRPGSNVSVLGPGHASRRAPALHRPGEPGTRPRHEQDEADRRQHQRAARPPGGCGMTAKVSGMTVTAHETHAVHAAVRQHDHHDHRDPQGRPDRRPGPAGQEHRPDRVAVGSGEGSSRSGRAARRRSGTRRDHPLVAPRATAGDRRRARPYHPAMDDLRAALGASIPTRPSPGRPGPGTTSRCPRSVAGPPWAMAEMIAAEPALGARVGARVVADGSAAALAGRRGPRGRRVRGARGRHGLRHVRARGDGHGRHPPRRLARRGAAGLGPGRRPGVRAGPGAAATRARDRDQPRGRHRRRRSPPSKAARARRRPHGAGHGQRRGARRGGGRHRPGDAGAGPELVPHRGLRLPAGGATVTAGILAGGTPNPDRLRDRLAHGIEAAHAPGPGGVRPDAAIGRVIADAAHLLVVASGVDRVTARELTLKVEEAAYVPSAMRDLETFLHGHLPATGSGDRPRPGPPRARRASRPGPPGPARPSPPPPRRASAAPRSSAPMPRRASPTADAARVGSWSPSTRPCPMPRRRSWARRVPSSS